MTPLRVCNILMPFSHLIADSSYPESWSTTYIEFRITAFVCHFRTLQSKRGTSLLKQRDFPLGGILSVC